MLAETAALLAKECGFVLHLEGIRLNNRNALLLIMLWCRWKLVVGRRLIGGKLSIPGSMLLMLLNAAFVHKIIL